MLGAASAKSPAPPEATQSGPDEEQADNTSLKEGLGMTGTLKQCLRKTKILDTLGLPTLLLEDFGNFHLNSTFRNKPSAYLLAKWPRSNTLQRRWKKILPSFFKCNNWELGMTTGCITMIGFRLILEQHSLKVPWASPGPHDC